MIYAVVALSEEQDRYLGLAVEAWTMGLAAIAFRNLLASPDGIPPEARAGREKFIFERKDIWISSPGESGCPGHIAQLIDYGPWPLAADPDSVNETSQKEV